MFTPEAQLDRLTQQLNLTDEQKAKIKPILEDQAKQMETLRGDTSVSPQDRRSQFMQLRENTSKKIRAVLDPDQQKKYDEMQNAQRRFGGPGGNRPPQPPPQ
jgi:Spy/CpxP family protein refolding chaperone